MLRKSYLVCKEMPNFVVSRRIGVCFDFNGRSSDELVIKMTILSPPFLLFRFWGYVGFGCFFYWPQPEIARDTPVVCIQKSMSIQHRQTYRMPSWQLLSWSFLPLFTKLRGTPPPFIFFYEAFVCKVFSVFLVGSAHSINGASRFQNGC